MVTGLPPVPDLGPHLRVQHGPAMFIRPQLLGSTGPVPPAPSPRVSGAASAIRRHQAHFPGPVCDAQLSSFWPPGGSQATQRAVDQVISTCVPLSSCIRLLPRASLLLSAPVGGRRQQGTMMPASPPQSTTFTASSGCHAPPAQHRVRSSGPPTLSQCRLRLRWQPLALGALFAP